MYARTASLAIHVSSLALGQLLTDSFARRDGTREYISASPREAAPVQARSTCANWLADHRDHGRAIRCAGGKKFPVFVQCSQCVFAWARSLPIRGSHRGSLDATVVAAVPTSGYRPLVV